MQTTLEQEIAVAAVAAAVAQVRLEAALALLPNPFMDRAEPGPATDEEARQ